MPIAEFNNLLYDIKSLWVNIWYQASNISSRAEAPYKGKILFCCQPIESMMNFNQEEQVLISIIIGTGGSFTIEIKFGEQQTPLLNVSAREFF
jgi:hypothetical protein